LLLTIERVIFEFLEDAHNYDGEEEEEPVSLLPLSGL
jgi:hypothetical protein